MLVLTRTAGQGIMIGDGVEVVVLSTDGRKVRLGIQAPAEVSVHRTEIYIEIQAQHNPPGSSESPQIPAARRGIAS